MEIKTYLSLPFLYILKRAAQEKIKQVNPIIIGLTGSVGKSSLLIILDTIIRPSFKVKSTFKGNSETGLPLEILGLREELYSKKFTSWIKIFSKIPPTLANKSKSYQVLLAEMGIDSPFEPKNMSYLLKIIQPQIGILLNIAPVHTQQFEKALSKDTITDQDSILKLIANEKGRLVTSLPKNGTAIINLDNPYIQSLIPQIKANIITFGETSSAMVRLTSHQVSLSGTAFKISFHGKYYPLSFPHQLLFKEYGLSIAAAIACASTLDIPIIEAVKRLENGFNLPPGRLSLIPGVNSSLIIDSSYNSSPQALQAALKLLSGLKTRGQKIAVLGDMRELGVLGPQAHREAAGLIKDCACQAVLVGPLMKEYTYPELLKLGYPKDKVYLFNTSYGAGKFIKDNILKKGDLILVKGSQNTIFLEQTVLELMENPLDAAKLLCRQSKEWDQIRQKFFAQNTHNP